MIPVQSSDLAAVDFDPDTLILTVLFHSGGCYQYHGVSRAVFEGLLKASSKGGYLARCVKGRYPYCRIE